MRTNILAVLAGVLLTAVPALAADRISNAKAAEFSLHRIERLVILRKLDITYQTRLERIDVAVKSPQQPAEPTFVIRGSQVAGEGGSRMTVDLTFDDLGRPLTQVANAGAASINPIAWPGKDATTLAENALHWVIEQGPLMPEVTPFFEGMTSLVLAPAHNGEGAAVGAEVTITIAPDQPSLVVSLDFEGTFTGYEILPALQPKYSSILKQVIERKCQHCHGAGGEVERIPLSPLADLLDSPRELVLPGNSTDSGLTIALMRTDDKRMPPPKQGPPLSQAEIDTIIRWIDEGARP